jgi:hypothetical protein
MNVSAIFILPWEAGERLTDPLSAEPCRQSGAEEENEKEERNKKQEME